MNKVKSPYLARLVGWDSARVRELSRKGEIIAPDADGWYDRDAAIRSLFSLFQRRVENAHGNIADDKRRVEAARADLLELELAKRRGKLIEVKTAEGAWSDILTTLKSRLLSLPNRVGPLVLFAKSADEARQIVEKEVRTTLEDLSKPVDYCAAKPEEVEEVDENRVET